MAEKLINLSVVADEEIILTSEEALKGEKGDVYVPSVNSDLSSENYGDISWELKLSTLLPDNIPTVNVMGPRGYTFSPTVDATTGVLSWTNNGGLDNPAAVDLTGPRGPQGIQGIQGIQGEKGDPFTVAKTFKSVAEMNAGFATDGIPEGSFVVIDTGNVEDEENARLYVKGQSSYTYLTDLSGAQGMKGDPFEFDDFTETQLESLRGPQGPKGDTGLSAQVGGFFTLSVDEDGNLWAYSEDDIVPNFEYDAETGLLYFVTEQE